jgi:hypothetical protein
MPQVEEKSASHYSTIGREANFQPFLCHKWRRSLPATTPDAGREAYFQPFLCHK